LVTFSPLDPSDEHRILRTNFYALTDSDEDVADMLLMVLAFKGPLLVIPTIQENE
jgi:hypothetical protein